jgi:Family of unknown function (DUF6504)
MVEMRVGKGEVRPCMAHQYGQPIEVTSLASEPQSFMWHGREYTIVEILAVWHLRDRW